MVPCLRFEIQYGTQSGNKKYLLESSHPTSDQHLNTELLQQHYAYFKIDSVCSSSTLDSRAWSKNSNKYGRRLC